jgi:DNA-binding IclR family transcriptional regulator
MQTVDRALQALDLFTPLRPEVTVADVARDLEVDRSIASRLLAALEARHYVAQDPLTGRFRLGIRTLELGALYLQYDRLVAAAVPHLEALAGKTEGTANVFVLHGGEAVRLASYPARSMTGIRVPAHCTAAGKVLLAALPRHDLDAVVALRGLLPCTPHSITTRQALDACLEDVRRRGVAEDREERNLGRGCLAAPVHDVTRRTVAAVSANWRISQLRPDRLPDLVDAVRDAALAISDGLGPGPVLSTTDGAHDQNRKNGRNGRSEETWNGTMGKSGTNESSKKPAARAALAARR